MRKPSNIERLMHEDGDYLDAQSRWNEMVEKLQAYCGKNQIVGGVGWDVPMLTPNDNGNAVEITLAGKVIRCEFYTFCGRSIERFGYVNCSIGGECEFRATSNVLIDRLSNVLEGEDETRGVYSIAQGEFRDGVFFAHCLNALDSAWKEVTGAF